jgi:hypothetical protein
MDEFSTKVKNTLQEVTEQFLFLKLEDNTFEAIEKAVEDALEKTFGEKRQVRWTEHSKKMARNTFTSTFLIQDDNKGIRKFTISPDIAQVEFRDVIDDENGKVILVERNKNDL